MLFRNCNFKKKMNLKANEKESDTNATTEAKSFNPILSMNGQTSPPLCAGIVNTQQEIRRKNVENLLQQHNLVKQYSTHTHTNIHTSLIKPPTLKKLTCQLSLVHYKTYRLHRD